MNILCVEFFCLQKTHDRTLLFISTLLKHGHHFDYGNQPLNMSMRVCYIDCHEVGLCCYLLIRGTVGKFPDWVKKEMMAYLAQFWLSSPSKLSPWERIQWFHRFLPRFRSTVEVISLNAVECRVRFSLDVRHCFKTSSLQFHFQFGEKKQNHRGLSSASREDGEPSKLLLVTNSVVFRDVCEGAFSWWSNAAHVQIFCWYIEHVLEQSAKEDTWN
jgi:hypothetical protein